VLANPGLTSLLNDTIGEEWICDLDQLRGLESHASDPAFVERWRAVKRANKTALARHLLDSTGIQLDPDSIYDVQVKRIHEYKRQHLNILHVIALYQRIKAGVDPDVPPRSFIFGGKAAPGYFLAKLIIKLINAVANIVNNDPQVRDRLRVVFMPNFNVTTGQIVYPATDLSEQISLAGKEASGTGNMKFAMNGALTIGTMDGANVELREEVGADNFFDFGLETDDVHALANEGYRPLDYCERDPELASVIELIRSGLFSRGDTQLFAPLLDNLLLHDPYFVLADFRAYSDRQRDVGEHYVDVPLWTKMAVLNTARSGKFSSDRTIMEYCDEIWRVQPTPIALEEPPH
jgi:starch phosphorylase